MKLVCGLEILELSEALVQALGKPLAHGHLIGKRGVESSLGLVHRLLSAMELVLTGTDASVVLAEGLACHLSQLPDRRWGEYAEDVGLDEAVDRLGPDGHAPSTRRYVDLWVAAIPRSTDHTSLLVLAVGYLV